MKKILSLLSGFGLAISGSLLPTQTAEPTEVVDLLAALRDAVEAAKRRREATEAE